jgi:hypothetical protein
MAENSERTALQAWSCVVGCGLGVVSWISHGPILCSLMPSKTSPPHPQPSPGLQTPTHQGPAWPCISPSQSNCPATCRLTRLLHAAPYQQVDQSIPVMFHVSCGLRGHCYDCSQEHCPPHSCPTLSEAPSLPKQQKAVLKHATRISLPYQCPSFHREPLRSVSSIRRVWQGKKKERDPLGKFVLLRGEPVINNIAQARNHDGQLF